MFFGDKKKDGSTVAGHVPVDARNGVPFLDLRDEVPPTPFVAIIELIERADVGDRIVAVLPRKPKHLFPELEDRGWSWKELPDDGTRGLRLQLTRTGAGGKSRGVPDPDSLACAR